MGWCQEPLSVPHVGKISHSTTVLSLQRSEHLSVIVLPSWRGHIVLQHRDCAAGLWVVKLTPNETAVQAVRRALCPILPAQCKQPSMSCVARSGNVSGEQWIATKRRCTCQRGLITPCGLPPQSCPAKINGICLTLRVSHTFECGAHGAPGVSFYLIGVPSWSAWVTCLFCRQQQPT